MLLKLEFDFEVNPILYEKYCRFIFRSVKKSIHQLIDPRKYKVRERYILQSSVIRWRENPPTHIDLVYYVENCLEMRKIKGVYVIRLNDKLCLPRSFTKVSTLVRLLEYGNEMLPALPLIRRVLMYYKKAYPLLILEFVKERFFF